MIGSIDIDIRNIFDKDDARENTGLYRLADRLHIRTRRSAVQAQLLFKSGDKYRAASSRKPNAIYACCCTSTMRTSFR